MELKTLHDRFANQEMTRDEQQKVVGGEMSVGWSKVLNGVSGFLSGIFGN